MNVVNALPERGGGDLRKTLLVSVSGSVGSSYPPLSAMALEITCTTCGFRGQRSLNNKHTHREGSLKEYQLVGDFPCVQVVVMEVLLDQSPRHLTSAAFDWKEGKGEGRGKGAGREGGVGERLHVSCKSFAELTPLPSPLIPPSPKMSVFVVIFCPLYRLCVLCVVCPYHFGMACSLVVFLGERER